MKAIFLISILILSGSCGKLQGRDRTPPDTGKKRSVEPSGGSIFSQIVREKGLMPLTYEQVRTALKKEEKLDGYYFIPRLGKDIESKVVRADANLTECGASFTMTIAQRVADCKNRNSENALWIGKNNSINGEGNWELVFRLSGMSIWRDSVTGLLWTDSLGKGKWDAITGNLDDSRPYCMKTPMNILGNFPSKQVTWRIPTRNDFLQADINGSRFVLNNTGLTYWTGSQLDQEQAWAIKQATGSLSAYNLDEEFDVRCVGIVTE